MTAREFFNEIITSELNDDMKAYAKEAIAKLDKRNEKRNDTPTKNQKANLIIKDGIIECLTDEPQVASEIAKLCDISTQKASALLKQLVTDGKVNCSKVKIKGKGELLAYSKIA